MHQFRVIADEALHPGDVIADSGLGRRGKAGDEAIEGPAEGCGFLACREARRGNVLLLPGRPRPFGCAQGKLRRGLHQPVKGLTPLIQPLDDQSCPGGDIQPGCYPHPQPLPHEGRGAFRLLEDGRPVEIGAGEGLDHRAAGPVQDREREQREKRGNGRIAQQVSANRQAEGQPELGRRLLHEVAVSTQVAGQEDDFVRGHPVLDDAGLEPAQGDTHFLAAVLHLDELYNIVGRKRSRTGFKETCF